jgi:hypothetical protein
MVLFDHVNGMNRILRKPAGEFFYVRNNIPKPVWKPEVRQTPNLLYSVFPRSSHHALEAPEVPLTGRFLDVCPR